MRLSFQPRDTMRASLTIMQAGAGRQGAGRPSGRATKPKVSSSNPAGQQPWAAPGPALCRVRQAVACSSR